jgi:5-formyltetrahydrofolate cyclo-ligase
MKKCVVIGTAYEDQFLGDEILPTDEFDQKVDFVVNEKGIIE